MWDTLAAGDRSDRMKAGLSTGVHMNLAAADGVVGMGIDPLQQAIQRNPRDHRIPRPPEGIHDYCFPPCWSDFSSNVT
jgi:hypothetical protein